MNLRNAGAIARKDLLDAIRNYRLLAVILMPIGFSVLFGFLYRDTPSGAAIVVYDPGGSQIVKSIGELEGWSLWVADSEAAVESTMTRQNALAGVILPIDFDARLAAGERPPLKLILNGSQARSANARRLVVDLVLSQSRQPLPVALTEETINLPAAEGQSAGDQAASSAPAVAAVLQALPVQGYLLLMWAIMGIAMVGMYMVPTLLVEETERKTLDALLVAPVSYVDLIAGKAVVGVVYALLSAGLVFVLNPGVPIHSVGGLAVIGLLSALFATLLGLWLGGMFNNTQALNTWSSFPLLAFLMPVLLVAVPSDALWSVMQFFPPTHILEGIGRALSGESVDRVWVNALVLLLSCVAAGGLVWLSLRRRERA